MADLSFLKQLPEVRSAVLSDPSGGLVDVVREPDGESVAAVMAFLTTTLGQAGEELGLGSLGRLSFAGPTQASLVVLFAEGILSAVIQPPVNRNSFARRTPRYCDPL